MTRDPLLADYDQRAEDGDGAFAIAAAILRLARAIDRLGNNDAATPMGAIEALGAHIGEKMDLIAEALSTGERE